MATYKVLQDVEAEDHILGPLSLRQFIYGLVTAFFLYLCFVAITKHAAFLLILFLPPALFTGFFAFPFGKDQPTEVWALAKLRFLFKPRRRIWDQSGIKELVTVTVPKKIDIQRTNGLDQTEVKSRLEALASTIDSRGWAIKNATSGGYAPSMGFAEGDSDRLVNLAAMPTPVPDYTVMASEDILDEQASPIAQQFTQMINSASQNHRQQLIAQMNSDPAAEPAPVANQQWFNGPIPGTSPVSNQVFQAPTPEPEPAIDEAAVLNRLHAQNAADAEATANMFTLQPSGSTPPPLPNPSPVTTDAAILQLATNNDLNVATLAREASKTKELDGSNGEVVIALH